MATSRSLAPSRYQADNGLRGTSGGPRNGGSGRDMLFVPATYGDSATSRDAMSPPGDWRSSGPPTICEKHRRPLLADLFAARCVFGDEACLIRVRHSQTPLKALGERVGLSNELPILLPFYSASGVVAASTPPWALYACSKPPSAIGMMRDSSSVRLFSGHCPVRRARGLSAACRPTSCRLFLPWPRSAPFSRRTRLSLADNAPRPRQQFSPGPLASLPADLHGARFLRVG